MVNGDKIRKLRLEKPGLTQHKLGVQVGLISNQVTKLENGQNKNPRLCTLFRIARYFEISVDDLMIKEDDCCI